MQRLWLVLRHLVGRMIAKYSWFLATALWAGVAVLLLQLLPSLAIKVLLALCGGSGGLVALDVWRRQRSVPNGISPGANLTGLSLVEAYLPQANLARVRFSRANLTQAYLAGANLEGARFGAAKLSSAHLTNSRCPRASFSRARLVGANLDGIEGTSETSFQRADLRDASIRGARLLGAKFDGADIRGANFEGTSLLPSALDNSRMDQTTTLPDGSAGVGPATRAGFAPAAGVFSTLLLESRNLLRSAGPGFLVAVALVAVLPDADLSSTPPDEVAGGEIATATEPPVSASTTLPSRSAGEPRSTADVDLPNATDASALEQVDDVEGAPTTEEPPDDGGGEQATTATTGSPPTSGETAQPVDPIGTSSSTVVAATPGDTGVGPIEQGAGLPALQEMAPDGSPGLSSALGLTITMNSEGGSSEGAYSSGAGTGSLIITEPWRADYDPLPGGGVQVTVSPENDATIASCAIVLNGVELVARRGPAGATVDCRYVP
jgi:hypothetical protein